MRFSQQNRIAISTGLALFAMFFGAGNMIFPLKLGSEAGSNLLPALIAFLIAGVGVPFLGLFAVSLYEGDYWKFFQRIGKIPAFLVITFLVLIIGPLFASPRTEIVTYHTLLPNLPEFAKNQYVFDFSYFTIVFILICNQSRVVDIIGWFLSPVKIIAFFTLIALGLYTTTPSSTLTSASQQTFNSALTMGYGTMDLLAAVFFCTIAYRNIFQKCKQIGDVSQKTIVKMTLLSCLIGAFFIGVIYTGLVLIAASHADALKQIPTEALIEKISQVVLGHFGTIFVSLCVSFACLATAAAVTEVATDFFYRSIFREQIPRWSCLLLNLITMFMMAILGFDEIMAIAVPILNVLYPALIVLCIVNIALKLFARKPILVAG